MTPHDLERTRVHYAICQRANAAAAKALRLWPGAIGEVLAAECRSAHEFPWLVTNEQSRTARLIDDILAFEEPEHGTFPHELSA